MVFALGNIFHNIGEEGTSISSPNKYHLRSLYRVVVVELEIQTKYLAMVDRVIVKDLNIHLPLCEVFCVNKGDSWAHGC